MDTKIGTTEVRYVATPPVRYGHLYAYLIDRLNNDLANCNCDLRYTREFCDSHGIDFDKFDNHLCQGCDCEVLLNTADEIPSSKAIPKKYFKTMVGDE